MRKLQILCKIQHGIDLYSFMENKKLYTPEDHSYFKTFLTILQKEIEENLVDKEEQ